MHIKTNEQKAMAEVEEFLNYELNDYSQFNYTIIVEEIYREHVYMVVSIVNDYTKKRDEYSFRYNISEGQLELDMHEDCWELVQWWESSVRYFWIKFDLWD